MRRLVPGNAQITVAQQKLTADQAAPVTQFVTINLRIPQSAIQILNDYTPDWQTVVLVGAVANVGVTVSVLVPGAGPVLAALLLSRMVGAGVDRYFDQNQTLGEAFHGAHADALGVTQIYAGITNRDIATNEHLGLTVQQQRAIIGEDVLQGTVTVVTMGATRFVRGMRPAAPRITRTGLGRPPGPPPNRPGTYARPANTQAMSNVPGADFEPNPTVSTPYSRPSGAGPTAAQRADVQGRPCVECGQVTPTQVADHVGPLVVQHYRDGAVNTAQQSSVGAVQPHCPACSSRQGGLLSAFSKRMKAIFGL